MDNTAKISDIITTLQELEGINQKADLKSALVSKGVDALDTDNMADLISKLNSANLVLNGKKFATSTGTTDSGGNMTVSGLAFRPRYVIIWCTDTSSGQPNRALFFLSDIKELNTDTTLVWGYAAIYNSSANFSNISSNGITSDGFTLNGTGIYSKSMKWIAYGA